VGFARARLAVGETGDFDFLERAWDLRLDLAVVDIEVVALSPEAVVQDESVLLDVPGHVDSLSRNFLEFSVGSQEISGSKKN
jgi:hypothetical protein